MNPILELLRADGSITVNKALIHAIGLNEAVLFCELLSRYNYFAERGQLDENGYFFNTQDDLQSGTGLGEKPQRTAISNLKSKGLIDYKLKGLPAKRYFKITATDIHLAELIKTGKKKMNSLKPLPLNKNLQSGGTRNSLSEKLNTPFGSTNNTNVNNTNPIIQNNDKDNGSFSGENEHSSFSSPSVYINEDVKKAVKYYFEEYENTFKEEHPKVKPNQLKRVYSEMAYAASEWSLDFDDFEHMIDRHFERNIDSDYNINHFATEGILTNLMFEVAY